MARRVLVTGANSGLGLATVVELARRGYDVTGSVRSEHKAAEVRAAAATAGVSVRTVLLDVLDADRCGAVVEALTPLHGLVNNAGFGGLGAVEDVHDDEARTMFETMVLAPTRLARLAVPGMRTAGGGRIVNVSSIFGLSTTALTGWYQGCKHALEAVSDALRLEVEGDGIAVVLVEPGGFRTGIWDDAAADAERRSGSRYAAAYARAMALVRRWEPLLGDPQRVARVVGRALDARRPDARYLVGMDARALALAEHLPSTAVKDRVKRGIMGL